MLNNLIWHELDFNLIINLTNPINSNYHHYYYCYYFHFFVVKHTNKTNPIKI
jgi:hypothetical protein